MEPLIVKGIVNSIQYVTKYDDDGIEYKQYTFLLNGQKYNAKTPPDIYFGEEYTLVLAIDPKSPMLVLSGYSLKDGSHWGKNIGLLKKHFSEKDTYEYVEGVIIEKRKFSSQTFDLSRDNYQRNTSYDILLEDKKFNTSAYLGEPLKPGMLIAAVLSNDDAYLIQDKSTGKIKGLAKPYYILFIFSMIVFTGTMMYYHAKDPKRFPNYFVGLIVINIFLFLAALLNFFTYRATELMKDFLKEKQRLLKN
jgi:hypothetical protein